AQVKGEKNTHTGLYAVENLEAGQPYTLTLEASGAAQPAQTTLKALPSEVPADPDGGLHVLLASCFYTQEANPQTVIGTLRAACAAVPRRGALSGPDLGMLMGDQVYLDMPLSHDVPEQRVDVDRDFEQMYTRNWRSCLAQLFHAAPHLNLPDDHEFWNNYPYAYGLAQNTRDPVGHLNWKESAKHMLARFQHVPSHREFDVDPVSFFVADGRSQRDPDATLHNTLTPAARSALDAWVKRVNRTPSLRVAVFVTGQSLLSAPAAKPMGVFADAAPSNYADYAPNLEVLLRLERPLLLITGDVHWGRVVRATRTSPARPPIYEVIVSPLSSVKDQRMRAWSALKRVVGRDRGVDWDSLPPEEPPTELGPSRKTYTGFFPQRPRCEVVEVSSAPDGRAMFRGDQLAMLSFHRTGGGRVTAKVVYWMIRDKPVSYTIPLFDSVP
ncbi:MAG TPA: hypothetical protein VFZ61_07465, partial [Polyangiales bacterium]